MTTAPTHSSSPTDTASRLAPAIRDRAAEAEALGHMPDETIQELDEAGFLTLLAPRSRGGEQVSFEEFTAVQEILGRACGSTSWVSAIYNGNLYLLTPFSDEVQEEVYALEFPKVAQQFNPAGQATRADGGYRLSGTWRFCTGHHHAQWAMLLSPIVDNDGAELASFLVPRDDWTSANDWQVSGLAGTGSDSLKVDDVFVPAHRVRFVPDAKSPSSDYNDPYFQMPLTSLFCAATVGAPLGLAAEALALFGERIQKRGITYTTYTTQRDAVVTHLQMQEATMKLDQARFHADRTLRTAEMLIEDQANVPLRVRVRADMGWTVRLCREVVETVQKASGASAIHQRDPLQRIVRDMHALSLHAFLAYPINAELYGRVLCGLEPDMVTVL